MLLGVLERQSVCLRSINVNGNYMSLVGAPSRSMTEALGQCGRLMRLDLSTNWVGVADMLALAEHLPRCRGLTAGASEGPMWGAGRRDETMLGDSRDGAADVHSADAPGPVNEFHGRL